MTPARSIGGRGRPIEPVERRVDLGALRLAARVWGRRGDRPVLGLHGWQDNAATFDRLAPELLPGLDLWSLDLPGHGLSDARPPGVSYHFVDYVADVVAAADALGWERFSLLSHSMGAAVSILLAGALPERVERLVCVEGFGPISRSPEKAPESLGQAIEARRDLRRGGLGRAYESLEAAGARLREANPWLSGQGADTLVARGVVEEAEGFRFRRDPRVRAPSLWRFSEEQVQAFLGRIACPVLLVVARDGWPVDREMMKARLQPVEDLEVLEVEGGHHVHLDHPERIAARVRGFLVDR